MEDTRAPAGRGSSATHDMRPAGAGTWQCHVRTAGQVRGPVTRLSKKHKKSATNPGDQALHKLSQDKASPSSSSLHRLPTHPAQQPPADPRHATSSALHHLPTPGPFSVAFWRVARSSTRWLPRSAAERCSIRRHQNTIHLITSSSPPPRAHVLGDRMVQLFQSSFCFN